MAAQERVYTIQWFLRRNGIKGSLGILQKENLFVIDMEHSKEYF